jgi:hypothetical protein
MQIKRGGEIERERLGFEIALPGASFSSDFP